MMKTDWMSAKNISENWDHLAQVLPVSLRPRSELVRALVRDHDDLRALAGVLKSDEPLAVKKKAYRRFADLLQSHSHAEEKAVYDLCLEHRPLRKETWESYTEHQVCDDLLKRIRGIRAPEKWQGAAKVLAEIVLHHVDEEERDLFPGLEREISLSHRLQAEARFLELRDATQKERGVFSGVLAELQK